ncbi:xylose isomerase domain-containing protein TIM barrel [Lacticaseibacillus camelliae DSM 22697 = JCM 13995]|uniref:Xylose isomerase domain-containing protein TIM barrel n=1 Tax=Lacticaseibacillus camelliae DSM 22697 = JCM 13995 TaxID=1423730 RepID=A0A0R2F6T9_9LACO|nr:xylose isomerase domain-containing protein TIM barrel [Lacticaseibacillus camelliae DSM 22697 = JCM 13995]
MVRGHDLPVYDDLAVFGQAMQQRGLHSLAYSPAKSLPKTTDDGDAVSFGLGAMVRRSLSEYGGEIATLSCYVNMVDSDTTREAQANARLANYLQVAPAFGTRIVATETGGVGSPAENHQAAPFNTLVKRVRELLTVARSAGTYLALEPGISNPLYSLDQVAALIAAVNEAPNLKLIIDPTNLLKTREDDANAILSAAFDRFADRIVAVHLKDYRWPEGASQRELTVPGQGQGDFKAAFAIADQRQPYGFKCLDELPDGQLDQALALPWLRAL